MIAGMTSGNLNKKENIDFCNRQKRKSRKSKISWVPGNNISSVNFQGRYISSCVSQGLLPCTGKQVNCYEISEFVTTCWMTGNI